MTQQTITRQTPMHSRQTPGWMQTFQSTTPSGPHSNLRQPIWFYVSTRLRRYEHFSRYRVQ